jgi:Holliday junction resolvase RusA-like endonuclease
MFIKQTKAAIGIVEVSMNRIAVEIMAFPPDKRCRDLDNIQKAIFDGLVNAKLMSFLQKSSDMG